MGMVQDCHPDHHMYQLFSEPKDVGFGGTSRRRTWVIGAHSSRSVAIADPFDVYEKITKHITVTKGVDAKISDYLVATSGEIMLEESNRAMSRNLRHFRPGVHPQMHLLTTREAQTMMALDDQYRLMYGRDPKQDPNLVYHLGDSPQYRAWSANSKMIPCYRLGSKSSIYWLPALQRSMTGREKLTSMGFPVSRQAAHALDVPVLGAQDPQRCSDFTSVLGNSMHLQTAGVMQLVALSCFGPWL